MTEEHDNQNPVRSGYWGCSCHSMTFCPDLVCVGYEDDQPVYVPKRAPKRAALSDPSGE